MIERINLLSTTAENQASAIIGGQASGIVNWNDIRYPQFYDIYRKLLLNYWIPDEISMVNDTKAWLELVADEKHVFKQMIGLLAILDSVQTRYLLESSLYVSDPSVHAILSIISQQEVVHNQSYSYVLSSLVPLAEQNAVFDDARTNPRIQERNQQILNLYEQFRVNPSPRTLAESLIGSIVLEGINFYSGFAFFYSLARRQLMVGTSTMISYIQRDEMQHCSFMAMLVRAIMTENPELDRDGAFTAFVNDSLKKAVESEIAWSKHILKGIVGIDVNELAAYTKYLANKRLGMIGLPDLFPGFDENVMPWIRAYSDESINATKTDFFEQKARTYSKVSQINGFDEL